MVGVVMYSGALSYLPSMHNIVELDIGQVYGGIITECKWPVTVWTFRYPPQTAMIDQVEYKPGKRDNKLDYLETTASEMRVVVKESFHSHLSTCWREV